MSRPIFGGIRPFALLLVLTQVTGLSAATPVAKRLLRASDRRGEELAANAALDQLDASGQRFLGWHGYRQGYRVDRRVRRTGPASACCRNTAGTGPGGGISQAVVFEKPSLAPIVVAGWSRAESVSGTPSSGYSVYVDLVFDNGTPLWGQTAPFETGTHDWQYRQVVIVPNRPVKRLTVYGLFRGHRGTVWFDDLSVQQLRVPRGAGMFDGALVARRARPAGPGQMDRGRLVLRDPATNSDFFDVAGAEARKRTQEVPELALELTCQKSRIDERVSRIDVELADLSGRDRAICLYYIVPIDATGWTWWDNLQQGRTIEHQKQYGNLIRGGVGATGYQSLYPFSCISGAGRACSFVVTEPRIYRAGYDAGEREYYVAFYLGLSPDTKRPGRATVSFYAAEVEPRWAMRATAQLYYRLLPQWFDQRRVPKRQGNWMAFTKISSVQRFQDFGFAVHEGNNDVRWDNDHGILPFVYVEPMTFWMPMPRSDPRSYQGAIQRLRALLANPKSPRYQRAWAVKLSGLKTRDGKYQLSIRNAPWCDGAVFANCADPEVPGDGQHLNQGQSNMKRLAAAFQAAKRQGGLAGVYLDSLEGWGFLKNWRRHHWPTADLPLTFDTDTKLPVLLNIMSTYEFTIHVARWVHDQGKLLMANSVPHRFPWLANPLDLMGTETNWLRGKRFAPPTADYMYLKRTMAWHKPYMFLMNTHYDDFGPELVERYMQRCLFYGMFPGFFSEDASTHPYFGNPQWYNRDRHLFKKYLPVIRQVAEAGWEPVTMAETSEPTVWIERFGSKPASGLYLTVMNTSHGTRRVTVRVDRRLATRPRLLDLLATGAHPAPAPLTLALRPEEVRVLKVVP